MHQSPFGFLSPGMLLAFALYLSRRLVLDQQPLAARGSRCKRSEALSGVNRAAVQYVLQFERFGRFTERHREWEAKRHQKDTESGLGADQGLK